MHHLTPAGPSISLQMMSFAHVFLLSKGATHMSRSWTAEAQRPRDVDTRGSDARCILALREMSSLAASRSPQLAHLQPLMTKVEGHLAKFH